MSAGVSCGVSFDGFAPFAEALDVARQSEAAGAASLWMAEHLGYRQSLVSCMAFALKTERAVAVPTAISPFMWHPMPVAMAMATLAEAAPGRAAIALGSGNPLFLGESGIAIDRPLRVMREFVECLRALWTGEGVTYEGEIFQLDGARMAFRPPEEIPIYIAAMGEQMLRMTGRIADGVVLSAGLSPDYAARSLALVAEGAAKAERDAAGLRRAAYIYCAVSEDGRTAIDIIRGKLAFLMRNKFLAENVRQSGLPIDTEAVMAAISKRDFAAATSLIPDEAAELFAVAGTPKAARDQLQAFIAAGIEEPVLTIVGEAKDTQLALDLIREVGA